MNIHQHATAAHLAPNHEHRPASITGAGQLPPPPALGRAMAPRQGPKNTNAIGLGSHIIPRAPRELACSNFQAGYGPYGTDHFFRRPQQESET